VIVTRETWHVIDMRPGKDEPRLRASFGRATGGPCDVSVRRDRDRNASEQCRATGERCAWLGASCTWPGERCRPAGKGDGGGGGSRTRVRKRAYERPYRLSPTWCFAAIVKVERNRPRLVRLISPSTLGPWIERPAHFCDALSNPRGRGAGRAGYLTKLGSHCQVVVGS